MKVCKDCGTDDQEAFYTSVRNMKCKVCMGKMATRKMCVGRGIQNAEKLKRGECMVCRLKVTAETTYRFDFDHRDPTLKTKHVSGLVHSNDSKIQNEMEKCDLLCALCHRDKTYKKVGIPIPSPAYVSSL